MNFLSDKSASKISKSSFKYFSYLSFLMFADRNKFLRVLNENSLLLLYSTNLCFYQSKTTMKMSCSHNTESSIAFLNRPLFLLLYDRLRAGILSIASMFLIINLRPYLLTSLRNHVKYVRI
jgi:hypothetical protein